MKRFLTLIFIFIPIFSYAQNKFEPQIKVSYELGIDDDNNQSFGGEFLAGYRLSNNFRIGLGLGIYWCKHLYEKSLLSEYRETASYIPIFLNSKLNVMSEGKVRPYISLDLGYSIFNAYSDYAKDNDLGFFIKPSFGVDFNLAKGVLFIETGYKYQDRKFQDVGMGYSQLSFSVGYQF